MDLPGRLDGGRVAVAQLFPPRLYEPHARARFLAWGKCEEQANTAVLTVGYLGGGWSGVDLKVENRPILGSLDQLPG